ncbi:MAG: trehalose-phosphatase [Myxococcales bacterium]|nr:trehalose-phosphatase [Myxococcales bacterium]
MTDSSAATPATFDTYWTALARAPSLAVLVDLDGTLIPFAPSVEEATLDDAGARLLRRLAETGIRVVVVSGRQREAIEAVRDGVPAAWWFAEHGAWRCADNGWQPPVQSAELGDLARRLALLADRTAGARFEQKSLAVGLHWRRVDEERRPELIAAAELIVDEWLETQPDFERLDGADVLEVRHRAAHKGTAVTWVRAHLPPETRLIALGDDVTDEDTFAALAPGDAAVLVGEPVRRSHAGWWVAGVEHTRALLQWLADARADAAPPRAVPVHTWARPDVAVDAHPLVIVSNRTPALGAGRGKQVGGLVSALTPIVTRTEGVWLGWSGSERSPGLELSVDDSQPPAIATFDYPPGWREHFYAGFCNQSLWPLLHCFPGRVRFVDDEWTAYVTANEAYARMAARLTSPTGTIWIHDYHLLLAGAALRRLGHTGPIGFFLHVPFPPRDVWETLPWHPQVIEAMTAYDLIGFHTARWADNFLGAAPHGVEGVRRQGDQLVRDGHVTELGLFPIGIEPAGFVPTGTDVPSADVLGLRDLLGDRKLLLGVDRLDYSKGIPERLEAFRRLLELYPRWRRQVSFVQVSVPSRAEVPEYAELRRRVEELVGRINGEYGDTDWMPVRYLYRSYAPTVLAQLYRMADVGVVTPLRDGMNLVAKEFVAAQPLDNPGALLLSRFAGAAEELDAALLTNPYHVDGVAADLNRALEMPLAERRARHARMVRIATGVTSTGWAEGFLARLEAVATIRPVSAGAVTIPGPIGSLGVRGPIGGGARA